MKKRTNLKNKIKKRIEIPQYLYHGTFRSNAQSILERGLVPSSCPDEAIWPELYDYGYIFLSKTPRESKAWPVAAVREGLESVDYIRDKKPVVFQIDTSKIDMRKLSQDPITLKDLRYSDTIYPDALKLLK